MFIGTPRHTSLILPYPYTIHAAPVCWVMKNDLENTQKCFECRCRAIQKAVDEKKPFMGMCINGIWEYMHPILINNNVVGIIFIGNILRTNCGQDRIVQRLAENGFENDIESLLQTMEPDVSEEMCRRYSELIDSYYKLLYYSVPQKERETQNMLMTDLQNFVDENYNCNLNLESLAQTFHYNEKYLGRYFKRNMGCSLKLYICRKRVDHAKQLLMTTNLHIAEIAVCTGFESIPYFNKCFRQITGMTPTEFRKQKQELPDKSE